MVDSILNLFLNFLNFFFKLFRVLDKEVSLCVESFISYILIMNPNRNFFHCLPRQNRNNTVKCVNKRGLLVRCYYVRAKLTDLFYTNAKDLTKSEIIQIKIIFLYFVSFCYLSLLCFAELYPVTDIYRSICHSAIFLIYI